MAFIFISCNASFNCKGEFKTYAKTDITQDLFCSLYVYLYFLLPGRMEMLHTTNLDVCILLLGIHTLYQNSLLLAYWWIKNYLLQNKTEQKGLWVTLSYSLLQCHCIQHKWLADTGKLLSKKGSDRLSVSFIFLSITLASFCIHTELWLE